MAAGDSTEEPDPTETGFVVTNRAGPRLTPAVAIAVREAAKCYGLPPDAADELTEACEALLRRVTASADGADAGHFEVTIRHRPGRVMVQIDDQGVPYELADDAARDPQAAIHEPERLLGFMHERVDRIDYRYRGREGNRIELTKRITADQTSVGDSIDSQDVDPDQSIDVRRMIEADSIPFVRNVYRSFGYTYAGEWAYHAEAVSQLLESGALNAWVAATQDGAIVGHVAIQRDPPAARLGEGGAAVVDPAFRHHGIATKLGLAALEWTQQQELVGLFAVATTRHPHSQKACLDLGGRELGLLLGYIPAPVTYRTMDEGGGSSGVIVMYLPLDPDPDHEVHPPPQHRDMLRRIYDVCKLNGSFVEPEERPELSGPTRMDVSVHADRSLAELDVTRVGSELADAMRLQLDRLEDGGIATAYVDLPLSLPETPAACDELEQLGLSFAGVFPSPEGAGWRLRLQRVGPDVEIKRDDIAIASDFGADLRDYVLDRLVPGASQG